MFPIFGRSRPVLTVLTPPSVRQCISYRCPTDYIHRQRSTYSAVDAVVLCDGRGHDDRINLPVAWTPPAYHPPLIAKDESRPIRSWQWLLWREYKLFSVVFHTIRVGNRLPYCYGVDNSNNIEAYHNGDAIAFKNYFSLMSERLKVLLIYIYFNMEHNIIRFTRVMLK